jgi:protein-tyrosine phosphatase
MAEALLRQALSPGRVVASAGLEALEGCPAAEEAQRLMAERGLDISGHRGRQLTPAMAMAADLILVMEARQQEDCQQLIPSVRGRVFLLGHWQPAPARDIADPFGQDLDCFRRTLERISWSVADWQHRLVNQKGLHA